MTCIVPYDGHRNQASYIRVLDKPRKDGGKLKMLHRIEWEKAYGPIPEGYEVNHKCKNRQCSNVNHLELLTRSEHRAKDNAERYRDRTHGILVMAYKRPDLTQNQIAKHFGVSQATVSKTKKDYTNG